MSCAESFRDFAKKLVFQKGEEINIYKEMISIFREAELAHEEAGLFEKLYNIIQEPNLYVQIGDIMKEKLQNFEVAKIAYNKFLHLSQPDFYQKYITVTDPNFKLDDDSNIDRGLLNLTDKFTTIVYMMVYFFHHQNYAEILEFDKYLDEINRQIDSYLKENSPSDISVLEDIINSKAHLASLLAQTSNHNDINRLALKLDPSNEAPYLNIIDDLVQYDNYNQALDFYNNVYCKAFTENQFFDNPISLCWFLSDKYSAIGDFYNSICRQKKAIDLELCGA